MKNDTATNGIWKTIATYLIAGIVGWFTHAMLTTGEGDRMRLGGTSTGWSKDQEQNFLFMPMKLDSILSVSRRNESLVMSILALSQQDQALLLRMLQAGKLK